MVYLPREEGQGLVEYGLVLVLLAIVVVVILATLGTKITEMYSRLTEAFNR